ncbi:MAG: SUMF1/EgtB/PvdO family nonheme iron enzyme [Vicinamibacterales bacterium]
MPSKPALDFSLQLDRSVLIAWYRRNRERSRALFDMLVGEDAYYAQPIALRHPIVFYEGHLPAFSFNTLAKRALGAPSIDAGLETLFARGIDPDVASGPADAARNRELWPSRARVREFAAAADRAVFDALAHAEIARPGHPLLDRGEAVFTILEHEAMHQETLLYMWHRLPHSQKLRPDGYEPRAAGAAPAQEWIDVPAGRATLGVDRDRLAFGWDNEHPSHVDEVAAFSIQRHDVTSGAYLEFVEASGAEPPLFWERHDGGWYWRGMFDLVPLPASWPVYVSQEAASAYARWHGARLPTEAEFQRAAYGAPDGRERQHPWGGAPAAAAHGVFDFSSWDPEPAGSHPAGQSAWGVDDLVGNGWEWTSTLFAPFAGFRPMASYPQYSADFFDDAHVVMKGASPATARELLRPTLRNWFRPGYPCVYATFRCVRSL